MMKKPLIPESCDVLCGKGKVCSEHKGNQIFKEVVDRQATRYLKASKREKSVIVQEVIREITVSHGARFLKKGYDPDKCEPFWYDAGKRAAREKIGHALRWREATIDGGTKRPKGAKRSRRAARTPSTTDKTCPTTDGNVNVEMDMCDSPHQAVSTESDSASASETPQNIPLAPKVAAEHVASAQVQNDSSSASMLHGKDSATTTIPTTRTAAMIWASILPLPFTHTDHNRGHEGGWANPISPAASDASESDTDAASISSSLDQQPDFDSEMGEDEVLESLAVEYLSSGLPFDESPLPFDHVVAAAAVVSNDDRKPRAAAPPRRFSEELMAHPILEFEPPAFADPSNQDCIYQFVTEASLP